MVRWSMSCTAAKPRSARIGDLQPLWPTRPLALKACSFHQPDLRGYPHLGSSRGPGGAGWYARPPPTPVTGAAA